MDSDGWVKMHRKILQSKVFVNSEMLQLWVYCLCRANHKINYVDIKTGKGTTEVKVMPGEYIFGRNSVSRDLNMNPSTLYKRMQKLERMGNIAIKSNTHYSTVSICNWDTYQSNDNIEEQPGNRQVTGREQPGNTDKNDNNDKNTNGGQKIDYKSFVEYWNEMNDCNLRITDKKREQIRARLRTYSEEELKKSIRNRSEDEWMNGDGEKYKSKWDSFWRNDEKPERYLTKKETTVFDGGTW